MNKAPHLSTSVLQRLRHASRLSDAWWEDAVGVRDLEGRLHSEVPLHLSESTLMHLADALDLDPESIRLNKVDYAALEARRAGLATAIPEIYRVGASSRIRTSAHLFDAVERFAGWKARSRILKKLQVGEAVLREADMLINIRFVTDACRHISELGVGSKDFFRMGAHSLFRNYRSPLGASFQEARSIREVYEKGVLEIVQRYYDQNFRYEITSMDDEGCVVDAYPESQVCQALESDAIGSPEVCANKAGVFASLPGYIGQPFSAVQETQCIHRGDARCRYEVRFSPVMPGLKIFQ